MIVVLGGGPAGRMAAVHLAQNGREVTLVEKGGIGGQCLHHGCMVVCALNDVARALHTSRNFHEIGVTGPVPCIDFPRLIREMGVIQGKIAGILDAETRSAGVEIIYGREGRIEGKNVILDGEPLQADTIIAATGSMPNIPDVDGIGHPGVYHPHTLSSLPSLPRELAIIGGGIMAAEFAYVFSQFGSNVHLVARSKLLRNLDPALVRCARKDLDRVNVYEDARLCSVDGNRKVEGITLETTDGCRTLPCDAVFIAAGLVPRSACIQGPKKGKNGRIIVDRRMRTNIDGLYACGDVTGSPCLTPVARREGFVAAENILGRETFMDYTAIPQFMALSNEYAFFESGNECSVRVSLPGPAGPGTFWSVSRGTTGMAQISVDPETGVLCGMDAASPSAGVIAAYQAFLMQKGITVQDFNDFLEVHPMTDGIYPLMKYVAGKLGRDDLS